MITEFFRGSSNESGDRRVNTLFLDIASFVSVLKSLPFRVVHVVRSQQFPVGRGRSNQSKPRSLMSGSLSETDDGILLLVIRIGLLLPIRPRRPRVCPLSAPSKSSLVFLVLLAIRVREGNDHGSWIRRTMDIG